MQAMAFIHGHEHESWHSRSMWDILPSLRWEGATYADINRKMPLWEIPIGHIQCTPKAQLLAEGPDVYNGSFPLDQASISWHPNASNLEPLKYRDAPY